MFERNRVDTIDQSGVSVRLVFDDGNELIGRLIIPTGRNLFEHLNGPGAFLEFEHYEGGRRYLAKGVLKTIELLNVPRAENLAGRLRALDGFDPYQILGLKPGAAWDEVRHAYHELSKRYHPDRYASAALPEEVVSYLSTMARRINAAYAALESAKVVPIRAASQQAEPIYTSQPRG
ncbi:MAG: J domain-containing protein [Hyphomicrobiaceae bacterium]|nr:J domain-containing protein [Hyphomicrobiaceae bacterium]